MLCTGFAERFSAVGGGVKQRSEFGLPTWRVGGGCLPIDFVKLCGSRQRDEEAVQFRSDFQEEKSVQKDFERFFNGECSGTIPSWSTFSETTSFESTAPWNPNSTPIYGSLSSSHWPLEWGTSEPFSNDFLREDFSPTSTSISQEDYHTKALARLQQLNLHLIPEAEEEEELLQCGYAQCQSLLERQNLSVLKHAQRRGCVHGGCGYVSGSRGEWKGHVLGGGCGFHEELKRGNWTEWEEGGRCCSA